jgi:hypothetical protein
MVSGESGQTLSCLLAQAQKSAQLGDLGLTRIGFFASPDFQTFRSSKRRKHYFFTSDGAQ